MSHDHIPLPPELVEEILFNLPVKSLLRFISVSKTWNSMVLGSTFVKRYRGRAMMVLKREQDEIPHNALICPLSSQNLRRDTTSSLVIPFEGKPYLLAWCDELWCVQVGDSLCLWNPSTASYGKLPPPSLALWETVNQFAYGLGYDSTNDDYKVLKMGRRRGKTELYSLRSNSWRKIDHDHGSMLVKSYSRVIGYFDGMITCCKEGELFQDYNLKMGVFVGGALHWLVVTQDEPEPEKVVLISFDLSTEKYGEVGLPAELERGYIVEMSVFKGKLSLCMNIPYRFIFWVMEEESWTKKLHIGSNLISSDPYFKKSPPYFRPLYLYDNGEFLVNVFKFRALHVALLNYLPAVYNNSSIFVYNEDEQTLVEKDFRCTKIIDSFVYVENLVSLAKLEKMNKIWEYITKPPAEILVGLGFVMVFSTSFLFRRQRDYYKLLELNALLYNLW